MRGKAPNQRVNSLASADPNYFPFKGRACLGARHQYMYIIASSGLDSLE